MNFIKKQSEKSAPFFMMIATPACHDPFIPAPQFKRNYKSNRAPRTPSFNVAGGPVSVANLSHCCIINPLIILTYVYLKPVARHLR